MDIREMNVLLGSLGVNVDQNLTIDWVKTELVNKAEQGDENSVYKMINLARHCPQKDIVLFIVQNLNRLGYEVSNYSGLSATEEGEIEEEETEEGIVFSKADPKDVVITPEDPENNDIAGLMVGDTDVESANYTISEDGKTSITIKKEYLTTLEKGKVTFKVLLGSDGHGDYEVTIAA